MADDIPDGELPDDPTIAGHVKVLRRVPPARINPNDGNPESSTFDKDGDDPGTSVTLWLTDDDLRIVSEPHPSFGVTSVRVQMLRDQGLRIAFVDEAGNPNHCEVYGGRTSGKRKRLVKASRWVRYPEGFPVHFEAVHPLWSIDAD